jgi:phosphoglycolate phosphatase-like HAD superfamily hydrolase
MTVSFAVFDIDGVLADVSHRLHHLQGRRKNWHGFFADAGDDPVLEEGRTRVRSAASDHAIVYLSGRPERMRRLTEQWLVRHALPAGALVLRPNRDRRPARRLKPVLVAQVRLAGEVALVVDDDADVCAALRAAGYHVLHAQWAKESAALRDAQERQGRS